MPVFSKWGHVGLAAVLTLAAFRPPALCGQEDPARAAPSALEEALERGNRAFDEAEFKTAIGAYEEAVGFGYLSSNIFLLLGNAHYRTGALGDAVLWWRRALVTDPLHAEAGQNLRFLNAKAGLLRFKPDTLSTVTSRLPRDLWMILGVTGVWAFAIGAVALSLRLPRKLWRTVARLICLVGFAMASTAFTGYLIKSKRDLPYLKELAIVTRPEIARTAATDDGATVTELPAGSEVTNLGERGPWSYVGIPGNLRGWIRTGAATPLWPFDAAYIQ